MGTYNPLLPKDDKNRVILNVERIAYWLSNGAQPTEVVAKFIAKSGLELPSFVTKNFEKLFGISSIKSLILSLSYEFFLKNLKISWVYCPLTSHF